jgi:hypothetical protein
VLDALRLTLSMLGCLLWLPASLAQQPFSFVALGDLPYDSRESTQLSYQALIKRINQEAPAFSIHIGDFKSGGSLCSNEEFELQRTYFQSFSDALVYTPGDNEWTDCHRSTNGAYDPLERLDVLRQTFFKPHASLGARPIQLQGQSQRMPRFAKYVENQRWARENAIFNTLHIVGSNNNLESRDAEANREFFERDAANVAWIQDAFKVAADTQAVLLVFAFQADVFESKTSYDDFPGWSGFKRSIGDTLLPLAQSWGGQVLILHGDSHQFKIDQPFTLHRKHLSNVTRLIVPGANDIRAVKVTAQGSALSFRLISAER